MNTERDKFLTEAMGECWHNPVQRKNHHFEDCTKCGASALFLKNTNDFSTWEGFGKCLRWCQSQSWFHRYDVFHSSRMSLQGVTPDRFADAVYKFLKDKQ